MVVREPNETKMKYHLLIFTRFSLHLNDAAGRSMISWNPSLISIQFNWCLAAVFVAWMSLRGVWENRQTNWRAQRESAEDKNVERFFLVFRCFRHFFFRFFDFILHFLSFEFFPFCCCSSPFFILCHEKISFFPFFFHSAWQHFNSFETRQWEISRKLNEKTSSKVNKLEIFLHLILLRARVLFASLLSFVSTFDQNQCMHVCVSLTIEKSYSNPRSANINLCKCHIDKNHIFSFTRNLINLKGTRTEIDGICVCARVNCLFPWNTLMRSHVDAIVYFDFFFFIVCMFLRFCRRKSRLCTHRRWHRYTTKHLFASKMHFSRHGKSVRDRESEAQNKRKTELFFETVVYQPRDFETLNIALKQEKRASFSFSFFALSIRPSFFFSNKNVIFFTFLRRFFHSKRSGLCRRMNRMGHVSSSNWGRKPNNDISIRI